MPPKNRFSADEIVCAATEIVRQKGQAGLTARAVAERLGASPKVIFGLFSGMDALRDAVLDRAEELYRANMQVEIERRIYPPYKASGMAYIRFAREEKELFRLLYMRDRTGEAQEAGEEYEQILHLIRQANAFTRAQAELLNMEMWACVHGLATMLVTGYQPLDEALVSRILTDVYQGVCAQIKENKK